MTDPDPAFPWLPSATVLAWLKLTTSADAAKLANAELCRAAAADWIEGQRKDLFTTDDADVTTFGATPRIVQAGVLATARLFARVDSPNGVVAFDELGAGSILSKDPDVSRYLGRNRRPALG